MERMKETRNRNRGEERKEANWKREKMSGEAERKEGRGGRQSLGCALWSVEAEGRRTKELLGMKVGTRRKPSQPSLGL